MRGCRYGEAGALWHIFARADTDALRVWLVANRHRFPHPGHLLQPGKVQDPVHDQVLPRPWMDVRFWAAWVLRLSC